jgi:hypothetical protein
MAAAAGPRKRHAAILIRGAPTAPACVPRPALPQPCSTVSPGYASLTSACATCASRCGGATGATSSARAASASMSSPLVLEASCAAVSSIETEVASSSRARATTA